MGYLFEHIFRGVRPEAEVTCIHCGWHWAGHADEWEAELWRGHLAKCDERTTSGALR